MNFFFKCFFMVMIFMIVAVCVTGVVEELFAVGPSFVAISYFVLLLATIVAGIIGGQDDF